MLCYFFFCQSLCKHPFGYSVYLWYKCVLCVKMEYLLNTFTSSLFSY